MALIKVEGIVLKETNYSEASKILTVLTKDYGLVSVMAQGCRNLKSKLRGVSQKFSYGIFTIFYRENGVSNLRAVDILDPFLTMLSDIEKISYATFLLELSEQVVKESNSLEVFELLIASLKKINEGYSPNIMTNILELKLLDYLGIRPVIDGCSICGSTKDIVTVSANDGGYLCKNCLTNQKLYSSRTVKLIRMLFYVDINKITKLEIREETQKEISKFIDEYYDKYAGIYLKSKNFLKNLNKISKVG